MPRKAQAPPPVNNAPVTRFKPQTQVVTIANPVKLPEELWDKVEALGHFIQMGEPGSKPADRNFIIEQALEMALAGEKSFAAFYQNQWPELKAKLKPEQAPEPVAIAATAGR